MRLLISANKFYPSIGGSERVALIIAHQLALRGHSVKVITFTESSQDSKLPFEVYRNPSVGMLFRLFRWSEIYIQNNVSFRLLWPLIFCWRPLVCVHHGFYGSSSGVISWRDRLKHLVTLFCVNLSVSRAVAESLPGRFHVVENPYLDDVFFRIPSIQKNRDFFFVGRLVSDKGIDILVEAIGKLRDRGFQPSLTVAGVGPEEPAIRRMVSELRLEHLVTFVGGVTDKKLNELLNAHKIMVVPSREGEGFGVVALEGIACGCVVVGSTCGGLPEAVGKCGRIFPTGDSSALAALLSELLEHPEGWEQFFVHAKSHLDRHRPLVVADNYLAVLAPLSKDEWRRTASPRNESDAQQAPSTINSNNLTVLK
jgi:glycogen(starch) synthase